MNQTLPLPEPPAGMEIAIAIRMPMEMGLFAKLLGLAVKAFGKGARLIPAGQWAYITRPCEPNPSKTE